MQDVSRPDVITDELLSCNYGSQQQRREVCMCLRRGVWLLPVLVPLLPHMLARLGSAWAALIATSGASDTLSCQTATASKQFPRM